MDIVPPEVSIFSAVRCGLILLSRHELAPFVYMKYK